MAKVRVCLICEERQGKLYRMLSVFGCDDEDGTRNLCEKCGQKDICVHRISNPSDEDTQYCYCDKCINTYYSRLER